MGAKVVVVLLLALTFTYCADLENDQCYYDIFSNDTKPEYVEFYSNLERLMENLVVTDDLLEIVSRTRQQLFLSIDLLVDQNVTQILFDPESLVLSTVAGNKNVNKSETQNKYFLEVKDLIQNLTDEFYGKCEDKNLIENEDYKAEDCYETMEKFINEAKIAYIESDVTIDEGLKLTLIKILINDEDVCDADSSTDTEEGPTARRRREIESSQTSNEVRNERYDNVNNDFMEVMWIAQKKEWMAKSLNGSQKKPDDFLPTTEKLLKDEVTEAVPEQVEGLLNNSLDVVFDDASDK